MAKKLTENELRAIIRKKLNEEIDNSYWDCKNAIEHYLERNSKNLAEATQKFLSSWENNTEESLVEFGNQLKSIAQGLNSLGDIVLNDEKLKNLGKSFSKTRL